MVLAPRDCRHRGALAHRQLVAGAAAVRRCAGPPCLSPARSGRRASADGVVPGDTRRPDLLEILLSGESDQLLHLLPDQQVPRRRPDRAGRSVRLSRGGSGGDHPRRSGRRSDWTQVRDLGLDSRRAPVHAGASLCDAVLDADPDRGDRSDSRLGIFRHPGLCAGADSGTRRVDLGDLFRVCVRNGRTRSGAARTARGPDLHRSGLSGVRVSAADWRARGVSSGRDGDRSGACRCSFKD